MFQLPAWAPLAALWTALAFAWLNFLTTVRYEAVPGALHGWRRPWYAAALVAVTILTFTQRRRVGAPVPLGRGGSVAVVLAGVLVIVGTVLTRLPPATWSQIPFKDDWTPLFQQAADGVQLMQRGVVVGWNWWFLGGYPTSTDVAQSFAALAFVPMTLFGDRLGYHVLHLIMFLAVPAYVWWDLRQDDRQTGLLAAGFACVFAAGYSGAIASSGDTNSLAGVFSAGLALVGSSGARRGRRWGGPLLLLGLTLALYSHTAFFGYALIYLTLEAAYFRDRAAVIRLVLAAACAAIAALPVYWESLRYPAYVSYNNTVYDPKAPVDWPLFFRTVYYHIEILFLPHRWFNDYRGLINIWGAPVLVVALTPGRSRAGYYACAAILTQVLLRLNTSEVGAVLDRIQHMLPMLMAPALAGFVLRYAGTRALAAALIVLLGFYMQTSHAPVRHVAELRDFNPPLMDRIAASDGMVLVEVSPHRDMDSHPDRRTPTTPFDVHFEGLLPSLSGQRFYSQRIDGWVFNVWRGQVVGAGTFAGRAIAETPIDTFIAEMERWGVRHLFVWTDAARQYLRASRFVERWRDDRWSHVELLDADVRTIVIPRGTGQLRNLDALGADVRLDNVVAGDEVVVRMNYYPAWRAFAGPREVELYATAGQLAFRTPDSGSYEIRLVYPSYRPQVLIALMGFITGIVALVRWRAQPL